MHKVNAHPGSHNQTLRNTCLILSYKLSLINCLISKLALSVRMEWWNGRTFGAVASLFLISVSWSWYVFKGREGSWIANTFTTHSPSLKEVKYIKLLVNKKKKWKIQCSQTSTKLAVIRWSPILIQSFFQMTLSYVQMPYLTSIKWLAPLRGHIAPSKFLAIAVSTKEFPYWTNKSYSK